MKRFMFAVAMVLLAAAVAVAGGKSEAAGTGEATTAAVQPEGEYRQSPMLASRVQAGELEPVDERLPEEPLVLTLERSAAPDGMLSELKIGTYGGTVRLINGAPNFGPEMYFMTIEPILARPGWISLGHPLTPNIFRDYEISPDSRVYTFYLRKGMRWSDGEPLTTEDVLFHFEDILQNEELTPNIGQNYRAGMKPTGEVYELEAVDDYTYRVRFAEPTPGWLDEINKPWMDYTLFIQPKHYLQQFHADYADPEELAKRISDAELLADEWARLFQLRMLTPWEGKTPEVIACPTLHPWIVTSTTATTVNFERNPYYWKVDTEGNQLPYIDRIVSTKVEGSESANLKIIAGEVDLADELAKISEYPMYKENESKGYRVVAMEVPYNPAVHALNFGYDDPVWRRMAGDVRFRRALAYAINSDEIIDAIYYGLAETPSWVPGSYDPAQANRLLDQVGLNRRDAEGWRLAPNGERFEINIEVTPHLPDTVPANELVVEHYKDVGLFTTLKTVDIGLYSERKGANQYQIDTIWNEATTLYAFGHGPNHLAHPNPLFNQWYNSGGEEGMEPPAWFKELHELASQIGPGRPWSDDTVAAYKEMFHETVPQINFVESPKTSVIVGAGLDNVFTNGVGQWLIYSAEQLFYR